MEKDPWGLTFKIMTKKLVRIPRQKPPGLKDPDRKDNSCSFPDARNMIEMQTGIL